MTDYSGFIGIEASHCYSTTGIGLGGLLTLHGTKGDNIDQIIFKYPPPTDMCGKKCPVVSMGGQAEGQACGDPGARTPH